MRIISGKLKGSKIRFIKNTSTRPLKDSVKENIFNIINHSKKINVEIKRANILDIYSGIGSFGLECISREAEKVTFVERDIEAVKILNQNINHLSAFKNAKIFNNRIEDFIKKKVLDKYDIIFLDPPFADKNIISNLKALKLKKIYKREHILIIHRSVYSKENLDLIINQTIIKTYGKSKIIFGNFY